MTDTANTQHTHTYTCTHTDTLTHTPLSLAHVLGLNLFAKDLGVGVGIDFETLQTCGVKGGGGVCSYMSRIYASAGLWQQFRCSGIKTSIIKPYSK